MPTTSGAQYRYSIAVKDSEFKKFQESTSYYSLDQIKGSIKTILENWPQYSDQNTNSQSQVDRWLILRYVRGLWQDWFVIHYLKLNDQYDGGGVHVENTLMGGMQVVANTVDDVRGLPLSPRELVNGFTKVITYSYLINLFKPNLPLLAAYKKVRPDVTAQNVSATFNKDLNYFLDLLNPEDLASMQELMRQEYKARQQGSSGLFGFESQDADLAFADAFLKVGVTVLFAYIGGAAISSFSSAGGGAAASAEGSAAGAATESGTLAGSTGLLGSTSDAGIVSAFGGEAATSIGSSAAGSGAAGLLSGLGNTASTIAVGAITSGATKAIDAAIAPKKDAPQTAQVQPVAQTASPINEYLPFGLLLLLLL